MEIEVDALDSVTEASAAAAPGAPQLYDHVPGNVVLDVRVGDPEKVEAAAEDIEFAAGRIAVAGTDRAIGIMDLAKRLRAVGPLPQDVPNSLHARTVLDQAHGGIVQGIGKALHERVTYSEEGQVLTASHMDYGLPRADDLPAFAFESALRPCTTNPLGAKGCGEAGCAGSLPTVMNAIPDALGGRDIDMPATPERVWAALRG